MNNMPHKFFRKIKVKLKLIKLFCSQFVPLATGDKNNLKIKWTRIRVVLVVLIITAISIVIFYKKSIQFLISVFMYIRKYDQIHNTSNQSVITTAMNLFLLVISLAWIAFVSSFLLSRFTEYRFINNEFHKSKQKFYREKLNLLSFRNFLVFFSLISMACIGLLTLAGIMVPSALGPFYYKLAELLIYAGLIAPILTAIGVIINSAPMLTKLIYNKKPILITTVSREDGLLYYLALTPPKLITGKQIIEGVIGVRSASDTVAYIGYASYVFSEDLNIYNYFLHQAFWYLLWHLTFTELAVKLQNTLEFLPYMPVVKSEEMREIICNKKNVFQFQIRECEPNCCFPEKVIDDSITKLGLSIDEKIIAFCWFRISFLVCTAALVKTYESYKLADLEIRETDRVIKISYADYKRINQLKI